MEAERFYLRMYFNLYVPYFTNYDRMTIGNICKHLKKATFDTNQVIMSRGQEATCMYIVISGEVGIYVDEKLNECVARLK
jgi:CRP-like cAMP-binding protein